MIFCCLINTCLIQAVKLEPVYLDGYLEKTGPNLKGTEGLFAVIPSIFFFDQIYQR